MQGSSLGNNRRVSAFAPASIGNVAVGFDVLGQAIQGLGDTVTVEQSDETGVRVIEVTGCVTRLPTSPRGNTAAAAIKAMADDLDLVSGFELSIEKGIPLGSGMGGSAASAVAAVVAVNQMLKIPLAIQDLFPYALAGESVASGTAHGDNVGAALVGGLAIVGPSEHCRVIQVPAPNQLRCVVVHPDLKIETSDARAALPETVNLGLAVAQSANLAALITACFQRDIELVGLALRDVMIEPHRSHMIPGFDRVKAAAMENDALGCSISGAGPSVFAWFNNETSAGAGLDAMVAAFEEEGLNTSAYASPVNTPGARIL
jgi:homoserine kinase